MSMPGPSEPHLCEDPDRIRKFYTGMSDGLILRHVRAMLDEISRRPDLDIPMPMDLPVIPECVPMMIDPKTELEDEAYLEVHHKSTGIEYNYEDDAYTWNPRFAGNQTDLIKRVNTLNEYGRRRQLQLEAEEESEDEESSESRSSSPPRPSRRASRGSPEFRRPAQTMSGKKPEVPVVDCECSICSTPFTTISSLLDHRREAHSEADMLTCGRCKKVFGTRTQMTFHLTQEYKVHHCTKCKTSFASSWHLGKHVCQLSRKRMSETMTRPSDEESSRLQAGEDGCFKCVRCGKQYMHIGWLEKHLAKCDKIKKEEEEIEEEEEEAEANFKCDICLRVYTSSFWFETHKKKCNASTPTPPVVLPGKPTARCQVCGKMFQNERSLEFHMRHCRAKQQRLERQQRIAERGLEGLDSEEKVQRDQPKVYMTRSNRGVVTRNRSSLKEESEEESEEDEDEEEEEDDNSDDEEQEKKKESEEKEEDQKKFEPACSICGQICSGVINLLSHRRSSHGNAAMLTCGICGSKFNCQSSITRHMNMEYSLYLCKKCGRNCHDSTVLRQHACSTTCRPWNYHVGRRSAIVPKSVRIVPAPKRPVRRIAHRTIVQRTPPSPTPYFYSSPTPSAFSSPAVSPPNSPKIVTVTTALQKALRLETPTLNSRHQQGTIKCPDCLEIFTTSFSLYNHRMSCDPKRRLSDDTRLQPSTSTASTSSSGSGSVARTRTDTIRTTDSADETQPIKCPECQQEFMYLREVAHHRFTRHGKQEFECLHCPKSFALLRTLNDHWNLELKRWQCQSCDRLFTRRYLLNDHQRDGCEHD